MLRSDFLLGCCALALLTSACTVGRPPPEAGRADLEAQLAAAEERLSELSRQVAQLQSALDRRRESVPQSDPTPAAGRPQGSPAEVRAAEPAAVENPPKMSAAAGTAAPGAQATPEALYRQALAAYQEGTYPRASALFDAFGAQHPRHPLADNALYWVGECHYARKRYVKAIDAFKSVLQDYPDGGKVPDALLKTAYSYLALGDNTTGRRYLQEVIRQYPFSPAGAKAEERLRAIR